MQYAETSAKEAMKEAQDVEEPFKRSSRRRSSASSTSPGRGCLGRSTDVCGELSTESASEVSRETRQAGTPKRRRAN